MPAKYLLPCSCGAKVAVEARQAAQTVYCECGRSVEVPALRELRDYSVAEENRERPRPLWTVRKGLLFIGLLIALGGFCFSGFFYVNRPQIDLEAQRREVQSLSLSEAWGLWEQYRRGIPREPTIEMQSQMRAVTTVRESIIGGLTIGCVGLMIAASGLLLQRSRARPS